MLYRYHKNWPLELSMAICMSVDISFIMEKSKLFDQTFELQEKKKSRDFINFKKYHMSETPSF